MPLPLLAIGAGLGAIGNLFQAGAAKKQAQATADAYRQGQGQIQDYYNQGQQAIQPYAQAGTQALNQYQQAISPQGRANFAQEYTQGPGYEQELARAEETQLRGGSALGNNRTGAGAVAFQGVQPQLINQAYGQQLQGLQGLMQQGAGFAGQTAGLAPQVGQQLAQYGVGQGQAQGQANSAYGNMFGTTLGQLGGLATYQGINPAASPGANPANPWGSPYGNGVGL